MKRSADGENDGESAQQSSPCSSESNRKCKSKSASVQTAPHGGSARRQQTREPDRAASWNSPSDNGSGDSGSGECDPKQYALYCNQHRPPLRPPGRSSSADSCGSAGRSDSISAFLIGDVATQPRSRGLGSGSISDCGSQASGSSGGGVNISALPWSSHARRDWRTGSAAASASPPRCSRWSRWSAGGWWPRA